MAAMIVLSFLPMGLATCIPTGPQGTVTELVVKGQAGMGESNDGALMMAALDMASISERQSDATFRRARPWPHYTSVSHGNEALGIFDLATAPARVGRQWTMNNWLN